MRGTSAWGSAGNGETVGRGSSPCRCHLNPLAIIGEGNLTWETRDTRKGTRSWSTRELRCVACRCRASGFAYPLDQSFAEH